jgi:hypothetical protein
VDRLRSFIEALRVTSANACVVESALRHFRVPVICWGAQPMTNRKPRFLTGSTRYSSQSRHLARNNPFFLTVAKLGHYRVL